MGSWIQSSSSALVMMALAMVQPAPLLAAERTALIQYIYLVPQAGSTSGCLSSVQSSQPQNPAQLPSMFAGAVGQSAVAIYQGLQNRCDFILTVAPPPAQRRGAEGFQKSLTIPAASDQSQSFTLTSTFLVGSEQLGATPNSIVWFHHVDAGPGRTGSMPGNFARLYQRLSTFSGFQGFQVWTWKARPNHWTVITSWKDEASSLQARRDPQVISIWDAIELDTAAPKQTYPFRLLQGS